MTESIAKRTILVVLVVWISVIGTWSITIDQARQLAIERYPLIKDYNLIELTQEYTLDNASKAWLPQITMGLQSIWQSDVVAYPETLAQMLEQRGVSIKGMEHLQWKASVDVYQNIWDGGRIKAAQEIAKSEAVESALATEVELYQLRQRIDELFFGILLLDLQAQSIKGSISVLDANVNKVNSLVRNGAAMQCDADAIEAELLTAQQQLISVQRTAETYRTTLSFYIGVQAQEELQIPEVILVTTENNTANRPEAKLMAARQTTLHAKLSQLDAAVMPQLSAFAQGYYGYPGMNFMEAMTNHSPSINAMIGLKLSWNISSLYTKRNTQQLLRVAEDRIDVAHEVFDFNIDLQATKERSELRRLLEISEKDEEILNLRQRVRVASEARLREGIVEPLDLLKSITDEKNAAIAANSHRIEYIRATYKLQYILNN